MQFIQSVVVVHSVVVHLLVVPLAFKIMRIPLLCAYVCAFVTAAKNPVVRLADGSLVEGKATEFGPVLEKKLIHRFSGIPFAKPPIGH